MNYCKKTIIQIVLFSFFAIPLFSERTYPDNQFCWDF